MKTRRYLLLVVLLALAAAGCGPGAVGTLGEDPPAPSAASHERETTLNKGDFDAAVRHLAGLPYLPWKYTSDGCYARAFYFSMTLASMGIPSNHVYCVAKSGYPIMGRWRYHVAPVVKRDGDPSQLYVLDPLFDRNQSVRLADWVARQDARFSDVSWVGYPNLIVQPGTSYGSWGSGDAVQNPRSPDAARYGEPPFAQMPSYSISTINSACEVMHRYIELEEQTSLSTKLYKHRRLSQITLQTLGELSARGKLSGSASQLSASCRDYQAASGPAGCMPDDGNTNPTSKDCCLASVYFCWSNSLGRCMAPGSRVGSYQCGDGGNWVTPSAPAPTPPAPTPPSPAPSGSWSCARSSYLGAQLWTCDGQTHVRKCVGSTPTAQTCTRGCYGAAAGKRDYCISAAASSSWSCTSSAYGSVQLWTCSGGRLYKCDGSGPVFVACESGCVGRTLGSDDVCR
ncbi:MAG: hypothetical protein KC503_40460 [Myxococcales bacterium]|nr:hypothetical protein [Myxococcales bacterium]